MEDTLQIYKTKKDNYMLFSNSHLKLGKFIGNKKGFGFVDIEGDIDVFIAPNNTNNAIHGDSVIVEITAEKGSDLEGKIVKIVDRQLDIMVGEYLLDQRGNGVIDLDNEKVKLTIKVEQSKSMNAMEGHKVLVKVLKKIGDNVYEGQVIKVLGHKTDPGVDILSIAKDFGGGGHKMACGFQLPSEEVRFTKNGIEFGPAIVLDINMLPENFEMKPKEIIEILKTQPFVPIINEKKGAEVNQTKK